MSNGERPRPGPGGAAPPAVQRRGSARPLAEASTGGSRRPVGRVQRMKRTVRRALRGPRGKWALAASVGAVILVLGLLLNGFLSSPAPPLSDARSSDGAAGDLQSLGPTPGASATASGSGSSSGAGGPTRSTDIKKLLQDKFNNPLNDLRGAGEHTVTITASSSRPMPIVGYLVPTGSDAYGSRKKARTFTLTQRAYGKGYLAAVFIQADATGAPITCSVTDDGRRTNTESSSGAYGRQICLG